MISIKRFSALIIISALLATLVAGCEKTADKDREAKEDAAATQARKGTFQPSSLKSY
ncbi:MAG: hypothetical protein KKD63_08795 [Proteobacteria bacterium]|nr:hypothetical protein [Pseudomonadota bacterium]